jgi:hypothetical protein
MAFPVGVRAWWWLANGGVEAVHSALIATLVACSPVVMVPPHLCSRDAPAAA